MPIGDGLCIAVVEDSPDDAEHLANRITCAQADAKITRFETGAEFLGVFTPGEFHLVFLDIYMPGISGMDAAAAIRKLDGEIPIAFTTSSLDHSLEANRYRSLMYVLKPVSAVDIAHCLKLAAAVRENRRKDVLTFNAADRREREVRFNDIIYIEVFDHRCLIHTAQETLEAVTSVTIDTLDERLPRQKFLRCHQSYIVNLDFVQKIEEGDTVSDFIMTNGDRAYIRVKDFKKMKKVYEDYLFAETWKEWGEV